MAKDKRLYMTFPNDFWMHPKIAPLSTEAKWAFVEMNGYSRMQDLDGRIPQVMVGRFWTDEVVAELVGSHAERPLVLWDDGFLVIRDYAQHQQTTADREAMSRKRSESGKKGADTRWNSKPMASAMASAKENNGKGMAETETETELTTKRDTAKRGTRLTPNWRPSNTSVEIITKDAPNVDYKSEHKVFVDYWIAQPGQKGVKLDWDSTWRNWMRRKETDFRTRPVKLSPSERARNTVRLATELLEVER